SRFAPRAASRRRNAAARVRQIVGLRQRFAGLDPTAAISLDGLVESCAGRLHGRPTTAGSVSGSHAYPTPGVVRTIGTVGWMRRRPAISSPEPAASPLANAS